MSSIAGPTLRSSAKAAVPSLRFRIAGGRINRRERPRTSQRNAEKTELENYPKISWGNKAQLNGSRNIAQALLIRPAFFRKKLLPAW